MTPPAPSTSDHAIDRGRGWYLSPLRSLLILALALFLSEFAVMFILPHLPPMAPWVEAMVDGAMMVLMASPALFHLVLQPMERHVRERRRVEAELRESHEHLEDTVGKRTAELQSTNARLEREIAEHERTGAALRQSEARYRALFENMTEGFALHEVICDEAGKPCDYRFLEVNPAFERLTGLKREQVVGRTHHEVLPGDDPRFDREFGEVAVTGKPAHFENYSPVLKRHYEVLAYQPTPRHFAVVFMDISERKRAEEALRQAHAELEARVEERTAELRKTTQTLASERRRFSDVLDMLPAYVVLLSPDYHVPFANRFFQERFGEATDRRCVEYLFERAKSSKDSESVRVMPTQAPHRWELPGPDGRHYEVHVFPFTDIDGSPLVMEMGLDITERKRAEAALGEANRTLEQRVAERTAELRASNEELTRFNHAAVDRELRMIELKQEVNVLCRQAGLPPAYPLDFDREVAAAARPRSSEPGDGA
jgi:PAS domain S-box-containing protein